MTYRRWVMQVDAMRCELREREAALVQELRSVREAISRIDRAAAISGVKHRGAPARRST